MAVSAVVIEFHRVVAFRLPAALLAILFATGSVGAQTTAVSPGPRNGPNAQPLATPAYVEPAVPIVPSNPAAPPTPPEEPGPVLEFHDVEITPVPAVQTPARAKGATLATLLNDLRNNAIAGLQVDAQPGEALDAEWVRSQFRLNCMLDRELSAARVVTLVLTLNRIFLASGYVNSGLLLTAQGWPDKGGVLHLQLINGRIVGKPGEPTVKWVQFDSQGVETGVNPNGLTEEYVLSRLPTASETPFDGTALETQFRLLADNPAIRTINAQLVPGEQAGEATLSLTVDPAQRYDTYISIADSRSPSVGGYRVAIGGSARNTLIPGDFLSAEVGVTSGMTDGTAFYSAPLTLDSDIHARFSDDGAAVVDETFRSLGIHSTDEDWELGVSRTLMAVPLTPISDTTDWLPAESLKVGLIIAGRESASTLLGQPFSFSPGEVDGISAYTVLRATTDWVERGDRQVIALSGVASLGLQGTGSDVASVSAPKANFKTLLVQGNYARKLNAGSLELHVRVEGQAASGVLYSGERLAVGGDDTVRGYRENLLLADDGGIGSVEASCAVRFDAQPCGALPDDWQTFHASIFVDGAYVANAASPQPVPHAIESVGVNLNWSYLNKIYARVSYGYALNYVPPVGRPDLQDRGISFWIEMRPLNFLESPP